MPDDEKSITTGQQAKPKVQAVDPPKAEPAKVNTSKGTSKNGSSSKTGAKLAEYVNTTEEKVDYASMNLLDPLVPKLDLSSYFVRGVNKASADEKKINELQDKVNAIDMKDITTKCILVKDSGTDSKPGMHAFGVCQFFIFVCFLLFSVFRVSYAFATKVNKKKEKHEGLSYFY